MGEWSIIVPETTTNLMPDPQFHAADPDTPYTIAGDGAVPDFTRSTADQWIGTGCAVADISDGTYAIIHHTLTVTATSYTLSARVKRAAAGVVSATQCRAYFDSALGNWDSITALRDNWYLCVKTATATAASMNFGVECLEAGLLVDAMQLENLAYRTTHCDGEQPGCQWNGTVHASTSTRSALSRAGGRIYDLADYDMYVEMSTGTGMPRIQHHSQSYALLPGAYHQGTKVQPRTLIMNIWAKGSSLSDLHDERKDFLSIIEPDSTKGRQPFILRYTGASVTKDIHVRYDAGFEMGRHEGFKEQLVLRLLAEDPFWYGRGEVSTVLDTNDVLATLRLVGRVDGAWSILSIGACDSTVNDVKIGPDGYIYAAGLFTGMDSVANTRGIAYWNGTSWNAIGTGCDAGGVYALAWAPNGYLYAAGSFTTIGGVANTAYVAYWDGSVWNPMGTGLDATAYALTIGHDGNVYIGGNYTSAGGVADTIRICYWNHTTYVTLGDANIIISAMATGLDGKIYAGGDYTTIGGVACNRIAYWNGTAWTAMGTGAGNDVYGIAIGLDGMVYIAANTTNIGGIADADYVARWNGSAWEGLGTGLNNIGRGVAIGPDGMVYVAGNFTTAGDITVPNYLARWNGTAWAAPDIQLPAGGYARAFAIGPADPVLPTNYDIYVGGAYNGNAQVAGTATVTNSGTRAVHPWIQITRSGGTTATLRTLRNETTGKEMFLDYDLQNGETLTIDCRPGRTSATSNFYGNRADAILRGSDMATFTIEPGANTVSAFVQTTGSPTVSAYLLFTPTYWSAD